MHRAAAAVADCLLSQNYQLKPRQRAQRQQAAAGGGGGQQQPQRQHFAVTQRHTIGMQIPQQWQPAADAAGAAAEPFAAPAYHQQQQQAMAVDPQEQQQQDQQQQQQEMDVDQEEI